MLEIFLKTYKILGATTCIIFFILAILWADTNENMYLGRLILACFFISWILIIILMT